MSSESSILRPGRLTDAKQIALMSRDLIEPGLGWSWTPARVVRNMRCRDTMTLVVCDTHDQLIAFAIMYFGLEEAHLNLLAVASRYQRSGIGRRLLAWLEKSARVAGIATIYLEVRACNHEARCFYQALGFRELTRLPGYYSGREPAIRMARELRTPTSRHIP